MKRTTARPHRQARNGLRDLSPVATRRRWPDGKPILAVEEWWRFPASDPRSRHQAPPPPAASLLSAPTGAARRRDPFDAGAQ
jgi:hypothetical protein